MPFAPVAPLAQGDRVAVVAPSGPFDRESFDQGLALVAQRYVPVFTDRLYQKHRYLAGTDEARLAELQAAVDDESVRAVFTARGGYGAMRLLPALRLAGRPPRPLVGFSDVTALHAVAQLAGWRSLHGPNLTHLATQPRDVVERLFALLEGRAVPPLAGTTALIPGTAEGPLVGGNLSVFTRLLGTPFLPPRQGALLFLEDVGERPYRLDRMWTHLRLAGALDGLIGLVLGDFNNCEEPGGDYSCLEVLTALAKEIGLPCAAGFPVGHGAVNHPLPLGARVRLNATAARRDFVEPLVEGGTA
ncbi:MAG: LD-carboxypeptidase [Deltaproteobacteria bacterium]|nr:LD-carboxypeptidase [Deltaproteobacteria bacterium]